MNTSLAVSPNSQTLSNDADISCVTARPDEMLNNSFLSRSAENGSIVSSNVKSIGDPENGLFVCLIAKRSFFKILKYGWVCVGYL